MNRVVNTPEAGAGDDPLERLRRSERATLWSGLGLVILASTWAVWPLETSEVPSISLRQPTTLRDDQGPEPLNLAGFGASLWPTSTGVEAQTSNPPPPLRLQLIGITSAPDGGDALKKYGAAVYDPDADRMLVVHEGDRIGGRIVVEVAPALVRLRDDARHEWSLRLAGKGEKGAGS